MCAAAEPGYARYQPGGTRRRLTAPVTIRPPHEGDLDACAALIVARSGGDVHARRRRLATDLTDPGQYLAIAAVGREVVGFGQVMSFTAGPQPQSDVAPDGYYLVGLIVASDWRRHGIGERLTEARMDWVARRAHVVWAFANAANGPTLDLHRRLGFVEVTHSFTYPGVTFDGGVGVLLCALVPVPDEPSDGRSARPCPPSGRH